MTEVYKNLCNLKDTIENEIRELDSRINGTTAMYVDHPAHPKYVLREWKASLEAMLVRVGQAIRLELAKR